MPLIQAASRPLEGLERRGEGHAGLLSVFLPHVLRKPVLVEIGVGEEVGRTDPRVEIGVETEYVARWHVCGRGDVQLGDPAFRRRLPIDADDDVVVRQVVPALETFVDLLLSPLSKLCALEGEGAFSMAKMRL